jgi:hypothetical protein
MYTIKFHSNQDKQMSMTKQTNSSTRLIEDTPADLIRHQQKEAEFWANVNAGEIAAHAAEALAIPAFERLLVLAETRDSGQIRKVASFIAATHNSNAFKFDLFELRVVDRQISDDMLACLNCLRWATNDLYRLVPNGQSRVEKVIKAWGLVPQSNSTNRK